MTMTTFPSVFIVLLNEMRWCKEHGVNFNDKLAEARKQHQRMVREAALKEQP